MHVVDGGASNGSDVLFIHGWPEDWSVFEPVMQLLRGDIRVAALDLPGIGASEQASPSGDKATLAEYVRDVVVALGLRNVTLAGHDVGGQIAYAYLRAFPMDLSHAVIMNVAIPGVDPWPTMVSNPHIWHFGFHAIPELPEILVSGHLGAYFGYFFDVLAGPEGVSRSVREAICTAYQRPDALRAGFDWYRAFPQDERVNTGYAGQPNQVPTTVVRGDQPGLPIDQYVEGLRTAGLTQVRAETITECGHFAPSEQPGAVAAVLERIVASLSLRRLQ